MFLLQTHMIYRSTILCDIDVKEFLVLLYMRK